MDEAQHYIISSPHYFDSFERYRQFFVNFGVTVQDLKICKYTNRSITKTLYNINRLISYLPNSVEYDDPEFSIGSDKFMIRQVSLTPTTPFGFFVVNGGIRDEDTEIPFDRMYFRLTKFELVPYNQRQGGKTMRRRRKSKKIKKTRKSIKKGGNKMKCCMCGKKVDKENSMTPSICYKQNLDKAHRICSDCWWKDFSKENRPNHNCPGCTKNMPLTKVTYDNSETIDLTK